MQDLIEEIESILEEIATLRRLFKLLSQKTLGYILVKADLKKFKF